MDWVQLEQLCQQCTRCSLCETRTNVVFGVGIPNADIMFIGEGPGEQEDLKGEPFVGPAGKLLDDMLSIIDLDRRSNIYIANIVKCRPPRNRDPLEEEQAACMDFLRQQVALVKPKIIVCLGRIAATRLIRPDSALQGSTVPGRNATAFISLPSIIPLHCSEMFPNVRIPLMICSLFVIN